MSYQLKPAWNKVNDPKQHPGAMKRNPAPVTWEDLGGKNVMHTAALRRFNVRIVKTEEPGDRFPPVYYSEMAEAMFQVSEGRDAIIRVEDYKDTLDIYTKVYDFGTTISPFWSLAWAENMKEVIDEIKDRGLILHNLYGHIPYHTPRVPSQSHEYMVEKLGNKFLGWDNGESDCRFTLAGCFDYSVPESPEEAYEHFMDYEYRIAEHLQHYFITLSNNTYQHYVADLNDTRMVGNQLAQSKPSIGMWCSILRGAGKQYGLLWWGSPSEWNAWDAKAYGEDVEWGSPVKGTSLSLIRRIWFLFYMYGGSIIMSEHAVFDHSRHRKIMLNGKETEVPELSPVGAQHIELKNWYEKHPDRGVMYTPVALLWDFYTGFIPGRRVPDMDKPYHVWGNLPYQKGHYQIDMLFRSLFPGYVDSGFFHDERGFLTPTPCGDIFDVLLSNTPRFVLNRYNAVAVIGPTKIEGQLLNTIRDFIERGGSVALSVNQLTPDAEELFGVKATGGTGVERYAQMTGGVAYNEPFFTYHKVELAQEFQVIAETYEKDPLAVMKKTPAGGELLIFTSDFGLSDKVAEPPESTQYDNPLPPVYLLLTHVEAILLPWFEKWNIIDVYGSHEIQYLTNLTEYENKFIITLVNNSNSVWKGIVRFKDARITGGSNWMDDIPVEPCDNLMIELEPNSTIIYELFSSVPLVAFKEDEGPDPTDEELALKSAPVFEKFAAGDRPKKIRTPQ